MPEQPGFFQSRPQRGRKHRRRFEIRHDSVNAAAVKVLSSQIPGQLIGKKYLLSRFQFAVVMEYVLLEMIGIKRIGPGNWQIC
jgi:hypothetical protein